MGPGGDLERSRQGGESRGLRNARHAPDFLQSLRPLFDGRNGPLHQHPSRVDIAGFASGRRAQHHRGRPAGVVKLPGFPTPWVLRACHAVARSHHVISVQLAGQHWRVGFVARALPVCAGVHDGLSRSISVHQESGFESHLGLRSQVAEVPHHRGKHVSAGLEVGRRVHRFVSPVEQVAARRPPSYPTPVHEQLIAVVAADMDHEALRLGRQFEGPAEMVDTVISGRSARHGDPTRAPLTPDRIRLAWRGGALPRRCAGKGCGCNQRGGAGFQQKTPARRSVSAEGWRVWHALETLARRTHRVNSAAPGLCDLQAIEHGDFGKVQDECKRRCRHECPSHHQYRKRTHSDSANRQH